jgi:hypothetical protein
MSQPLVQDLTIVRGDNKSWTLTLTRNLTPVNLVSGTELFFTAKNSLLNTDEQAIISIDNIGTYTTGSIAISAPTTLGIATISLFPIATLKLLVPVTLQYDIQLKETSGLITTVAIGTLAVTPDVTLRTA